MASNQLSIWTSIKLTIVSRDWLIFGIPSSAPTAAVRLESSVVRKKERERIDFSDESLLDR